MNNETFDSKKTVGIIGCGWLGKALALTLIKKGVSILATSSQVNNVEQLQQQGIKAQQLSLPGDVQTLSEHEIFSQSIIVIAIPPKFKQGRTDYAAKITQIVNAAQQRGMVKHIVLLSSTGIYTDLVGLVNEKTSLDLSSKKVVTLHQAEQEVLTYNAQASVIRLAGLVGPNRHPGKFLLAKKVLTGGASKINLIHQADAVGLIMSVLSNESSQGVFNAVSESHASKKEYYQKAAKSLSLPIPEFSQEPASDNARIVDGSKAKQVLGYSFIYPDLLAWL